MFRRLFARNRKDDSIAYALYGTIVAQAREPVLYAEFGVPDTLDGRFDMIVLHAFLLFHRLKGEEPQRRQIGQEVFDLFLSDMDRSLREMGVGDISVPKKLKKMAEAFYGRIGAYDAALDGGDRDALAAALARNIFPDEAEPVGVTRLAAYVEGAARALAGTPVTEIAAGKLAFPHPAGEA